MTTINQRLDLRQSQNLVMTPQLQQAIKLLQLNNVELAEYIEAEIAQNPLLEKQNPESDSDAPDSSAKEERDSMEDNFESEAEPAAGSPSDFDAGTAQIGAGGSRNFDEFDESSDAGFTKAETLRARIAGGAEFAQAARESSEDPNSQGKGGDLGWFTQDEFGPEFGRPVAALQQGEVSQPIRTQTGWHVVELLGTRQSDVGDANRRAQVRETIGRRKLEDEWNRYLREMRGEAYVDVRGKAAEQAPGATPATPPTSGG